MTSLPGSAGSSSRSAAAPTRRSSPPSPTARSGRDRVHAVTAVSPSLAGAEHDDCRALAGEWGLRWTPVETDEMARAAYRVNDTDRCYHCKAELMDVARADRRGRGRHRRARRQRRRPRRPPARPAGGRARPAPSFPLVAAGFTKADVRAASRALGLRTWDKPAAACLASRVPYGTEVTVAVLSRVERAEAALRALGFRQLRVRHYGDTARIEVDARPSSTASSPRATTIVAAVRAAGYRYVTLDLEGFRSGNLNGVADTGVRSAP